MAKVSKAVTAFLEAMGRAGFQVPEDADIPALLTEELRHYSADDLRAAASIIIRTRKYPTWPTVGEVVDAVKAAQASRLPPSTRERLEAGLDHQKKKLARQRACMRIRNTALPDMAMKEGWLHGLIDFVAAKDRMPDRAEQEELRQIAVRISENLEALRLQKPAPKVKGWATLGGAAALPALQALRKAMMARAEREVFGELEVQRPMPSEPDAYAEAMAAAPDRSV